MAITIAQAVAKTIVIARNALSVELVLVSIGIVATLASPAAVNRPSCGPRSTGAANSAARDIARLGLMFVMRLLAFRQQEPFVDVMIDEVPRQHFVMGVLACDVEIRVGQICNALAHFALDRAQFMPNRARVVASSLTEPLKNRTDPAISA